MRSILLSICLMLTVISGNSQSIDYGVEYINAWKVFHPSKALSQGINPAIYYYEDLAPEKIDAWIKFNKELLDKLDDPNSGYAKNHHIDSRLLKVQIKNELNKWEDQSEHKHSLILYADLIDRAVDRILSASFLNGTEKQDLVCSRLKNIEILCVNAKKSLKNLSQGEFNRGTKALKKAIDFYKNELPQKVAKWKSPSHCSDLSNQSKLAATRIKSLLRHVEQKLSPNTTSANENILGTDEYARRLKLYTDSNLTPYELEKIASVEIEEVRNLIGEVSLSYLKKTYPNKDLPETYNEIVRAAFDDMEKDVPISADDYQQFWEGLSERAIAFIKEKNIATLPAIQTLRIISAPESAGPAARIGWVDSAAPFDPNPITTLYLPSIPDTLPVQEQKDFWASFNKPFNRMIVIHELFPGHYMQIKLSRETPHHVRLLFPYAPYFEGWATFTERVLLEEGWDKENPLTYLAHLRKRLENANRAYTSMQVHCNGWNQDQVMRHSTDTALLAPQFAKSLWGRIMRSPMQLTSYFQGGKQFSELYDKEKERLGDNFDLKLFMDTIMKTGPIPIDEFLAIFKQMN